MSRHLEMSETSTNFYKALEMSEKTSRNIYKHLQTPTKIARNV